MRQPLPLMDSWASYNFVCRQVEQAVKAGTMTREKAAEILKEARVAYSRQDYNKKAERINAEIAN